MLKWFSVCVLVFTIEDTMSRDVESSDSDFEQYRSYVYKLCQLPKRQRPTMREMLSDESMYSEPDDQTEATVAQENRADRVRFGAFGLGSSYCCGTGRSQGRAPRNGRGSCMI